MQKEKNIKIDTLERERGITQSQKGKCLRNGKYNKLKSK